MENCHIEEPEQYLAEEDMTRHCIRCRAVLADDNPPEPDGCSSCSALEESPCCGELADSQWFVRCYYCDRLACSFCRVEVAGKQVCIEPDCQAAAKAALVEEITAQELAKILADRMTRRLEGKEAA